MEAVKRCPFLRTETFGYCFLFPVKKIIPIDKIKTDSLCLSGCYQKCEEYIETKDKTFNKPNKAFDENVNGFKVRSGYLYHQGHTWIKEESDKRVRIGIDDFACRLLQGIDTIEFTAQNNMLKAGRAFVKVLSGNKAAFVISPVDGELLEVNGILKKDITILNRDPYGDGWILMAKVKDNGMKWLMHDMIAKKWIETESERLHSIIGQDIGTTMTDGGIIMDRLEAVMNEEEWLRFTRAFLLNG